MRFYLGIPEPSWLQRTAVPTFVSATRLRRKKKHQRALGPYAIDSGGFTELSRNGRWTVSAEQYADEVQGWAESVGRPDFAAIQDYMCEPVIRERTGLTVEHHQALTIANLLRLQELAPDVPWLPVLQGWRLVDYLQHVEQYKRAGVDLRACAVVGVGTVCRRQSTREGQEIVRTLAAAGIPVHAFGFKSQGIRSTFPVLRSADSMAWSFAARRRSIRLEGCTHAKCSNCLKWALQWRADLLRDVPCQPTLFKNLTDDTFPLDVVSLTGDTLITEGDAPPHDRSDTMDAGTQIVVARGHYVVRADRSSSRPFRSVVGSVGVVVRDHTSPHRMCVLVRLEDGHELVAGVADLDRVQVSSDAYRDSGLTHANCPICGRKCKILKGGQLSTHGGTALAWGSVQNSCKGSGTLTVTDALQRVVQAARLDYESKGTARLARDLAQVERQLTEWIFR